MRYAERRTAHSAGVVSYNKLEPAGVEVAVEGEGGRRSREPAGSAGAFVYAVSSRETLALARPRKVSPVTFNFRTPFEKASLSRAHAVRSPRANWVDDRVPCRVASRRLGSSAFGREKLFPARTSREASKRNRDSSTFPPRIAPSAPQTARLLDEFDATGIRKVAVGRSYDGGALLRAPFVFRSNRGEGTRRCRGRETVK